MPLRDPFVDLGEPSRIAFAGDWHMNADYAVDAIEYARHRGADVIVHTGDLGYTFTPGFLLAIADALRAADIPLFFVEGNHDQPSKFHGPPDRPHRVAFNLWHLPRGFRWTWANTRFLACGGAHSVDRQRRTPGVSWWPEELITEADVQRCIDGGPTDFLISHDCPTGVVIPGIDDRTGPAPFPPVGIALAQEHRRTLRRIVDAVTPQVIVHGHYHVAYQSDDNDLDARVIGLDMDHSPLPANIRLFDLHGGWVS